MAVAATVLAGLGTALPPRRVTNHDLAQVMDTSDEWIRTRTGIGQRYWSESGGTTADLATEAGARALKSAGTAEVDAVLVATTTPDRLCPGTAPEVASRLGLGGVAAFDVAAVCSGFVYGLATATGLIASGIAQSVLVIAAEAISRFLDPDDRGTRVIFGDGAGAVVLRAGTADELGAIGPFDLGSDGEGSDLIAVHAGGSRKPPVEGIAAAKDIYLTMEGREVYRLAIQRMVASSRIALDRAGWTTGDVDKFVGHQANVRILDSVADKLGIPADKRVVNIDRVGNTAAASIPWPWPTQARSPATSCC